MRLLTFPSTFHIRCKTRTICTSVILPKFKQTTLPTIRTIHTLLLDTHTTPFDSLIPTLHSDNHLLVINKPPGYHSQPNPMTHNTPSYKCLLSTLQAAQLGGGSKHTFLLPMHRLDQPCSGVMMLAKTSKAGSRIGSAFASHTVNKEYLVVVNSDLEKLYSVSRETEEGYTLSGRVIKQSGGRNTRSVQYVPVDPNEEGRICELQWKPLWNSSHTQQLLHVRTNTGARHQVRAMISQLGNCPIMGDLRYGADTALEDRSVALHAWKVELQKSVVLQHQEKRVFVGDVPVRWEQWFGVSNEWLTGNLLKPSSSV